MAKALSNDEQRHHEQVLSRKQRDVLMLAPLRVKTMVKYGQPQSSGGSFHQ